MNSRAIPMDLEPELSERDFVIGFAKNPPTYFDDRHNDNRYNSDVWKHFRMIRCTETQLPVKDWYMCTEPGCPSPFLKCIVGNGNSKLRRYLDSHQKLKPYTLSSSMLSEILSAASGLGAKYGKIDADTFKQMMPPSSMESWTRFMENVENHLNQQNTTTSKSMSHSQDHEKQSIECFKEPNNPSCHENIIGNTSANTKTSLQIAINLSNNATTRFDLRSKS